MREIDSIVNNGFISLSLVYASTYELDGKTFIRCFIRFQSVKSCCEEIVKTYKKIGAFDQSAPDFTGYVNKLDLPDRWRRVLGEILQIIYSIVKK